MNVIELLKKDHEKVSKLFKSYEAKKSEGDKEAIVAQLCEELSAHAEAEEELFYRAVEARGEEKAQDMVKEGLEEHKLVKTLVAELEEMSASEEQYDAKVKVLKELVEHHVEEEEGQMMPKAKKLLSSEELEELGTQVEDRKEELKAEYGEEQGKASGAASGRQNASPAQSRGASSSRSSAGNGASSSSVKASRSPRPARRRTASGATPSPAKSKASRKK